MTSSLSVAIFGISGFTGIELARLLNQHPNVSRIDGFGQSSAGKNLESLFPAFAGVPLTIKSVEECDYRNYDILFHAVPHGTSEHLVERIPSDFTGVVIDLSRDYRWKSPFTYGLTTWMNSEIKRSKRIANPGCFATAIQYGLLPVSQLGLSGTVVVHALTGSSGSGAGNSSAVHFSHRFGNVKSYKTLNHQHIPEVSSTWKYKSSQEIDIDFVPISGPFVRGIWASLTFPTRHTMDELLHTYKKIYQDNTLVHVYGHRLPELKEVVGSANTTIGITQNKTTTVIGVAIDNLIKGAAGQAIENMNIIHDFPADLGLPKIGTIL